MSLVSRGEIRNLEFRDLTRTSLPTPVDSGNLTNTPRYLGNGTI